MLAEGRVLGERRRKSDKRRLQRRGSFRQTVIGQQTAREVSQAQVRHLGNDFGRFYSHASRVMISPESYLLSLPESHRYRPTNSAQPGL
jgi:hypothetical protein